MDHYLEESPEWLGVIERSTGTAIVVAALVVVAIGVVSVNALGQASTDPTTYTGCLKNGRITSIAAGDAPLTACKKNEVQVGWNREGPPGPLG